MKRQIKHVLDLVCERRRTEGTMDRLEELEAEKKGLEAQICATLDEQASNSARER
ncbi:MAG: hypothetical protein AAGF49_05990 [Pseudomonadota bacterium]